MKKLTKRFLALASTLIITSIANGQTQVPNDFLAGQPARAAEVNENFQTLEEAIDQNLSDIATLNSDEAERRLQYIESVLVSIKDQMTICGDSEMYGCTDAISSNGTIYERNGYMGRERIGTFLLVNAQNVLDKVFWATPESRFDFTNLWIGGTANLTRSLGNLDLGPVLVDDCNNPTVELAPTGEPPSSRIRVNSGNFYLHMGTPLLETIDVTGPSYGLINPQFHGNIIEACTVVTDRVGLYDSYSIELKFNVFDGNFDAPWTYQ